MHPMVRQNRIEQIRANVQEAGGKMEYDRNLKHWKVRFKDVEFIVIPSLILRLQVMKYPKITSVFIAREDGLF